MGLVDDAFFFWYDIVGSVVEAWKACRGGVSHERDVLRIIGCRVRTRASTPHLPETLHFFKLI
eukprot:scaffold105205_cov87-Phaeocystis_antarctica.AAC.2